MAKKIFFATIPLQQEGKLNSIKYRWGNNGHVETSETRFPIIPLIEENVSAEDKVRIVAIKTNDNEGNCERNIGYLKEELDMLSGELGVKLEVSREIGIDHDESPKKHVQLMREIVGQFEEDSLVYMDVTFGTKATSICSFASLAYAEKLMNCEIAGILYGKYVHGMETGELYNLKTLYELNMIMQTAQSLPQEYVKDFLDKLWKD